MAVKILQILGGTRRGQKLETPEDLSVRPMLAKVRAAVMNILMAELPRAAVLDVFAGTGSLGLEALSRGASHAVFVETDPTALRLLRGNLQRLRFESQAAIADADAYRIADSIPREVGWPFDVVFFDPPYPDMEAPGGPARLAATIEALRTRGRLAPEAMIVVHLPVSDLAEAITPPDFDLVDQRLYGRTEIAFLSPREEKKLLADAGGGS